MAVCCAPTPGRAQLRLQRRIKASAGWKTPLAPLARPGTTAPHRIRALPALPVPRRTPGICQVPENWWMKCAQTPTWPGTAAQNQGSLTSLARGFAYRMESRENTAPPATPAAMSCGYMVKSVLCESRGPELDKPGLQALLCHLLVWNASSSSEPPLPCLWKE